MATMQPLVPPMSLIAGADLSGNQFRFVHINSSGLVVSAGDGGDAIGVLLNKPTSGQVAEVAPLIGIVKVVSSGNLTPGAKIQSTSVGKAATAATGDHVLGTLLGDPAADGEIVEVICGSNMLLP